MKNLLARIATPTGATTIIVACPNDHRAFELVKMFNAEGNEAVICPSNGNFSVAELVKRRDRMLDKEISAMTRRKSTSNIRRIR